MVVRRGFRLVVQRKKEARKVFRKIKTTFLKVVFALTNQERVQAVISTRTKAEARTKKEMVRKVLILNQDFQPQKHPVKKDMAMPGIQTIGFSSLADGSSCSACRGTTAWYHTGRTAWMASVPLDLANDPTHVVMDLGCIRSIESRAAIKMFQAHALYNGITAEFCCCKKSFVFANSETETCWDSCIIHFPTTSPC